MQSGSRVHALNNYAISPFWLKQNRKLKLNQWCKYSIVGVGYGIGEICRLRCHSGSVCGCEPINCIVIDAMTVNVGCNSFGFLYLHTQNVCKTNEFKVYIFPTIA